MAWSWFRTLAWALAAALVPPSVAAADSDAETSTRPLKVFYDQGFRFETTDGDFALRINGLIQLRYSYVAYDHEVRDNGTDYSNFYMRRARLYFTGHAFDPRFTYFIHLQLEPTRTINAHDLWLEYAFSDLLRLGAGRNKIAYGLEFLNSGVALGMVERSVFSGETDIDQGPVSEPGPRYPGGGTERFGLSWEASSGFATGGLDLYRSQGIQLRGQRGSATTPTFEYQLGLWQGRSTYGFSNDGNDHLYSVRVGYHPFGYIDWRIVGDGDDSPRPKLGVLASAYANSSEHGGGYSERGWDLAAMFRWRGVSVDAEWAEEIFDYDAFDRDFERAGWRVEAGWFVVPARVELRARIASIDRLVQPTYRAAVDSELGVAEVADGDRWLPAVEAGIAETSIGVNYFLHEWHRQKLQFDASRLVRDFAADPDAVVDGVSSPIPDHEDQVDYRIRAMIQLTF